MLKAEVGNRKAEVGGRIAAGLLRLFVYGTLKRGFENHPLLAGSTFLGIAQSRDFMAMWGEEFPYVSEKRDCYPIVGEIFVVNEVVLQRTDALEGHPDWYRRCVREFLLEDGEVLSAWIYLNDTQLGREPLKNGVWE